MTLAKTAQFSRFSRFSRSCVNHEVLSLHCSKFPFVNTVINEPTRISERSSTLIDLILTTNVDKFSESGIIHKGTSDHSLIYAIRKGAKIRMQPKVIQTRSYKHFQPENFDEDLRIAD